MNWDKVKNWVFGGGGAVVFLLLMGFVDWRVGVKVDAALSALSIGTDPKIVSMDTSIADNTRTGAENAEDISEEKQKLRDVANILMSDGNE